MRRITSLTKKAARLSRKSGGKLAGSPGSRDKPVKGDQKVTDKHPDYHIFMGLISLLKDEHDQAIASFQKAIDLNPGYANAYYNMGLAYSQLKEYRKAARYYQKAVAINPNHEEAYYHAGFAWFNLKKYRKAMRCCQKALEINPNYAEAHTNMGAIHAKQGNLPEAVLCYQKAARLGYLTAREALRKVGINW
jgi:superkiller protein 3